MTALIRAAALNGYEEAAREIGIDPLRAMQRVHLSKSKLADPESLVSYLAFIQLLELSAEEGNCPDFGMRLVRTQSFEKFGHLAVLLQHASTLGEALKLTSRYIYVHSPAVRVQVIPVLGKPDLVDVVYALDIRAARGMRQIHELAIGMIVKGIITVGQGQIMPLLVRIPHAQLGSTHSYVKTMTCMCEFDASVTAVRLTTQSLQHKLPAHNSQLHEYALKYLEEHFGDDPTVQFSERMRAMLRHFLGSGMGNQLDIAKMLAINPRTLQRRLAFEGKHFEDLVDEVRQEKFQHFLHSDEKRPLSQIAWMLGYAEQSALNRSCLRWFGCSPGALRDKLKISGAAPT